MKYLKFLIIAFMILLVFAFFAKKDNKTIETTQNTTETEQETQVSPDLVSILSNFLNEDLPISNLIVNIDGSDVEISGTIDKTLAESYLEEHEMLDFKTKLALFALPQTLDIKLNLVANTTDDEFSITVTNIQAQDYSLDTNFVIYSLNF